MIRVVIEWYEIVAITASYIAWIVIKHWIEK